MGSPDYDVVICGGTPFACLLAGLLTSAHGRRVCLVGERWSPYRMPHGFDISVTPSARPDTWALLKRGSTETPKLLGGIGRGLFERVDPLFVAETAETADYLGHMRWLALGTDFSAEKAVDRAVSADGAICRIRDAAILVGGKAEPAIDAWLEGLGVSRLPAGETQIAPRREGGYTLHHGDISTGATRVVLADDEAILLRLAASERHRLLAVSPTIALTTTAAAKALAAPCIFWMDRGVLVHQRSGREPVTAFATGEADAALPRIGASLPGTGSLHRAAQARFLRLTTTDGAPLVGRMGKQHFTTIAGLGESAAFFAPSVARYLAGAAGDDEVRYFEARDVSRARTRAQVADAPALPEAVS